jgi:hypothetical protein
MLEAEPRQVLRTALRCTSLEWERSKAWAFEQAMGLVWYYADSNPVMSQLGRTTLNRIMSASEVLPEALPAQNAASPGADLPQYRQRRTVPDVHRKERSRTREAICNRPALRPAPPDQRQPGHHHRHLQD